VYPHFHTDEKGVIHRCYHRCKSAVFSWQFWFGVTIMNWIEFLPEHLFWLHVWPFYLIAHWLGA
jgi:hypothetical protein